MSLQPGIPEGLPHELVYGYALDALDEHDTELFEAHLASCEPCTAELIALGHAVSTTLANTGRLVPPEWLEEELMARVFGEADAAATQATPVDVVADRRARKSTRRAWMIPIAVAASLVLLLGLGIGVTHLTTGGGSQVVAEDATAHLLDVTSAPDAHFMTMTLPVGTAKLVVSESMNEVALMANNLPMPAEGQAYHVWTLMHDGTAVSSAVFMPNSHGHVATMLSTGVSGATGFMLTVQEHDDQKPSEAALGEVQL